MRRAVGETYTADNKQKANILAGQFNPIVKADLADINEAELIRAAAATPLNITYKIIKKKLQKIIN